ncbi:Tex family protein [Terribacillus sp. DMT04]|uniref:Tex family protein n=1 Tax=Terribacillus sp. DMT04 TaxID=2850441 RepID=UPI001C2CB505|nr:Tex family protein [Terribacillus sp. DMT04]QXE02240.1 RNA-binding transcriptional accessory protein [Terribacillus sp. DMT04]
MEATIQDRLILWVEKETAIKQSSVKQVIHLLEEGNTVPFIARYRKEQTGALDEVEIKAIQDKWEYAQQLHQRKTEVIRLIEEQGKLTDSLKNDINAAMQLQRIEDLYRPYKQKRRTKATIAKEKGLEPLAKALYEQTIESPEEEAREYLDSEKELHTAEDVLQGANDIMAEWISEQPAFRDYIRDKTEKAGVLLTKVKKAEEDEKGIFEMYYAYQEPVRQMASHRVLAVNRGEKEGILRVTVEPPADVILAYLKRKIIKQRTSSSVVSVLHMAIEDSYKRLIQPSVEREIRTMLSEKAEEQAIKIFSENLKNLLLQPPLKGRVVLGVDPAFRTGCKLAVIDETGKLLEKNVIYPTAPKHDIKGASRVVEHMLEKYDVQLIAVGNGTASRETEQFIADVIRDSKRDVAYIIVNEAGASVYSASELARKEFPELQVEERSAISIGRRIQDPLAELVKIDPKSIGVGQYQHDVGQKKLNDSLGFVVETAVNQVGVNVNTASESLLQYVSGFSKTVAANVVKQRNEVGKFTSRKQLKSIPRLGSKTYEQSIGFLRVLDGEEPLDRTPIHPESYSVTKQLLKRLNADVTDIGSKQLQEKLSQLQVEETAAELQIGELTLQDIVQALNQPGRDPRDDLAQPLLKQDVLAMEDLKEGMELQGTVRNVVDFGVFVDIGVKQDGLVHISKMSNKFVKHPMDIASVGDVVTVWVDKVDIDKQRIALTMVK